MHASEFCSPLPRISNVVEVLSSEVDDSTFAFDLLIENLEQRVSEKRFECLRNKFSLLAAFSYEQIETFIHHLECRLLQEGEVLFECGDLPTSIYLVERGSLNADVNGYHWTLNSGDSVGESAVIGIQTQAFTVIAKEQTAVYVLNRAALTELAQSDQSLFGLLMMNIARQLSRQLHHELELR